MCRPGEQQACRTALGAFMAALGAGATALARLKPRLRIRTREQRYIVQDVGALEQILQGRGSAIEYVPGRPQTEITTVYLDTTAGTWSEGRSPTKLRVRSYQDPEQWWFELKRREDERVDKWRRPMSVAQVMDTLVREPRWRPIGRTVGPEPLQPVFGVRCQRTAYEWPGIRVTLDRDVAFFGVNPLEPLTLQDETGGITGIVVEVKSEPLHPDWLESALEGYRLPGYSKSRYALALLRGQARQFLVPAVPTNGELVTG